MKVNKNKILPLSSLKFWLQVYRNQGFKIVAANGIYDIFHAGHASSLEFSANLGDILIVGLNSDESTTKLKGPTRPINNQDQRAKVLCSLECVDNVIICENTLDFLKEIKPDIWVKSEEYTLNSLNKQEKSTVLDSGGQILFAPRIYDISTTKILEKLK